jgi:hypothetical protein
MLGTISGTRFSKGGTYNVVKEYNMKLPYKKAVLRDKNGDITNGILNTTVFSDGR